MPEQNFNNVVNFIWSIAEILRDSFKKSRFQDIILPFTVLRRFDYALEPTKDAVLDREKELKAQGLEDRHRQLCRKSGYAFYNTSRFTYDMLLRDDANLARNLRQYINGFSPNVREIFEKFNFDDQIRDLEKAGLLFLLMERFNEKSKVDLRPEALSNLQMGYVFEQLIRRFNESLNETPGEHFTPREIIRLMVDLILSQDKDLKKGGVSRTVYDCCCGTGGMLSIAKEHILGLNPGAKVHLFGQENQSSTWAVARSDMFILNPDGSDAENIIQGSTLSADGHARRRFDYMLANPPYGKEWKPDREAVEAEAARGHHGRFGAGLPAISDGQILFLQHLLARMNDPAEAPSHIAILFNGSPLFTGEAGSGMSEIRRWVLENDWLDCIIGLPERVFYNTGIRTYLWILTNRKIRERRGKVTLVDASGEDFWEPMRRNLGDKSRQISDAQRAKIVDLINARQAGGVVKIFDREDFGYRRIQVERPLRLTFCASAERLARLDEQSAFAGLAVSKKKPGPAKDGEEAKGRDLQAQIKKALDTLGDAHVKNRDRFTEALDKALTKAGLKLKAPVRKAILSALAERDEWADICVDAEGKPEPDADLRDYENVPLKEKVREYFAREVTPHVRDAWINEEFCDERDGQIGRVGYEIPFNRHFYQYQPPRSLAEIESDIRRLEREIVEMLKGVTA
jgi:type I restriction enzyme M protein